MPMAAAWMEPWSAVVAVYAADRQDGYRGDHAGYRAAARPDGGVAPAADE